MFWIFLVSVFLLVPNENVNYNKVWGQNGHRIVGNIAADYITPKTRKEIDRVLGHESLAIASTWMDEVRADPSYDYMQTWHWVTIPHGMTYKETEKNPDGDLINALKTAINELKSGSLSAKEEAEKLKIVIHLVGDIHQPLHVGTGDDRGGNDTEVEWFYEDSNLHRVWDTEMIEDRNLSYTEFSVAINHPSDAQLENWQNSDVLDWTKEAIELRDQVYNLPEDRQLSYTYQYKNKDILDRQLLKAGVRLAGVLNDIYGK